MNKFLTKDNIEIEIQYNNAHPDSPRGGMRVSQNSLWLKLPTGWIKSHTRSSVDLRNIIEKSTLEELVKNYE